uniref:Uncharacterized protein n=1 Tax=viral metagenome TaxID=1070528 RepID=A0A6M3KUC5_9ZZZZ
MADPNAPQHSEGYGPAEQADDTRQAQQTVSNDAPTDVNLNAVIARTQAGTFTLIGEEFAAAAARRTIIADKGIA